MNFHVVPNAVDAGQSAGPFPALDSERTLVIVFGAED